MSDNNDNPHAIVTTGPITHTADLSAYATALAEFQGQAEGAVKGRTNPHFKSRYARLEDAWRAAREPLAANGLSVQQWPHAVENGRIAVTTMVLHKSGQWVSSTLSLPVSKPDAQGCGSAITYACRYSFMAALGLPPEDDDDGNAASRPARTNGQTPPSRPPPADDKLAREVAWLQTAIANASTRADITALQDRIKSLPEREGADVYALARTRWTEVPQ